MSDRRALKETYLRILSELMKNSRVSDREVSKKLGISQPTVSRIRGRLSKEGYIKEYTVIPDFTKLGYSIMALTFPKVKPLPKDKLEEAQRTSLKDMLAGPSEIILFERGMGAKFDGVIVSLHKDYASYARLLRRARDYPFVESCATLLIDLNDKIHYRSLTLSTFADQIIEPDNEDSKQAV